MTRDPVRLFWLAFGLCAVALGLLGVVLPLLPTTPFLLLAAFAFARSSPRMHDWLHTHDKFGPLIENWRRHGAIDRRTKVIAAIVIAATFGGSALFGAPGWVLLTQAVVLTAVSVFILTRPDGPADTDD